MRFIISILVIAILSFVSGQYFPWWAIAVVAFGVAVFIRQKPLPSFISGFLGVFLLWVILSVLINSANAGILAGRMGELLGTGNNPSVLMLVTGLVGGLVAGFASLSASFISVKKS